MKHLTVAAMALAVLAGAPAFATETTEAAAKPKRDCFHVSSINGWEFIKPDIVRLQVGVNKYYDLKMMLREPDLAYHEVVGIRTRPGQPFVCGPLDIDIVGGSWVGRVPVVSITRVEKAAPQKPGLAPDATPGESPRG